MMMLPLLLAVIAPLSADTAHPTPVATSFVAGAPALSLDDAGDAEHSVASPAAAGFDAAELQSAEAAVRHALRLKAFPGAALVVGRGAQTVVEQGFGRLRWGLDTAPVSPDRTLYDLASLTKVVATTTAVMLLVEDEMLELDAPVSRYLPAFRGGDKADVTLRHLLTHTSGLPAWANLSAPTADAALARALATPLEARPGVRVEYSDVGFVILWAAAEAAAGEPLYRLLDRRVFGPLGMRSTTFLAGPWCERCAPTMQRDDGTEIRGVVHDPIARRLGGITGNAGLFSTAHDLARFAAMLAGGGELDGVRVLRMQTVEAFTRRQPGAGTRALGWDTPDQRGEGAAGLGISPTAFGHTGFTGTSLWIDPERGTWTVLLTNRRYAPRAPSSIQKIRRALHDRVAAAADAGAPPLLGSDLHAAQAR